MRQEDLCNCKRIVVKVGTSSITYPTEKISLEKVELMAREPSDLQSAGRGLLLTTSGGVGRLNSSPSSNLPEKQALTVVGQSKWRTK